MAPRDPKRPKAAQINDAAFLRSVDAYNRARGAFPIDLWSGRGWPKKVIVEKQRKLEARGFMSRWTVTHAGRDFMAEAPE